MPIYVGGITNGGGNMGEKGTITNLITYIPSEDIDWKRVVIFDGSNMNIKLPTDYQDMPMFAGVTVEQAEQDVPVGIAIDGIVRLTAAGTIARGDWVTVVDATGDDTLKGKVVSINDLGLVAGTVIYTIGRAENAATAGADVFVRINYMQYTV